jgi:hypothetical protein
MLIRDLHSGRSLRPTGERGWHQFWQSIGLIVSRAVLNRKIIALDIADFFRPIMGIAGCCARSKLFLEHRQSGPCIEGGILDMLPRMQRREGA